MTRKSRIARTVAAAAMTGMFAGAAAFTGGCKHNNDNAGMQSSSGQSVDTAAAGKHACKTMNDCKGQGGCNTGDNGCKGKNSCKGKGGCKTNGA